MPEKFFWPGLFFALTFLMLIFVPLVITVRLLPLGLIAGFGGGIALLSLLVTVLGYWGFNYPRRFFRLGLLPLGSPDFIQPDGLCGIQDRYG
ncbi:MAG: hypothetical protein ACOY4Q_10315 [Bacillota bacterium]